MKQIDLKQQIKEQYKKCIISPAYFLKNYAYIQDATPQKSRKIKFQLYPFQEETLNAFLQHKWNIILKSRQLGISTLCAGYCLWRLLFKEYQSICIVANKASVAKNLIKKIKIMYDYLPSWLKLQLTQDNKQSLQFTNHSFIKAESANADAAVSQALSLLIIDQAAVLRQNLIRQIWAAASPTLSQTNGDLIALSSPRGLGNWFHETWRKAEQGLNKFNPIRLHWTVHPHRDQKWRDNETIELGSQKKAKREYDCEFESTGNTVLQPEVLHGSLTVNLKEPFQKLYREMLWIFQYPIGRKKYILSADVARGDGEDFSAFHVLDVDKNQQVAEFKGQISTTQYSQLIIKIGKMYNDAYVVVENSNIGWNVVTNIVNEDYPNIHFHKRNFKYVDIQLYQKYQCKKNNKQKDVPGFTTSTKTRPAIIQKTTSQLENQELIIHSKRTFNEFQVFIWLNGKPQAMYGFNDDLVLSLCIGIWVKNSTYFMKDYLRKLDEIRLSSFRKGGDRDQRLEREKYQNIFKGSHFKSSNLVVPVGNEQINLYDFYGLTSKNKKQKKGV